MAFFQNLFSSDFFGNWLLADRHQSLRFPSGRTLFRNHGRGDEMVIAWNEGAYDLSGNDADGNARANLQLIFAIDSDGFKNWATITINISGAVPANTTASEITVILNANATFASYFVAELGNFPSGADRLCIKQKFPVNRMRFYVPNGRAEEAIRFNARADVAELPSYFSRHTMASRNDFDDSQNMLIELDMLGWAAEGDTVDGDIVFHAVNNKGVSLNLDPTAEQEDWELLEGRSGLFMFYNNTVDATSRITQSIQYQAGAQVGDMAKLVQNTYTGAQTTPDHVTEIPHVLIAADLITPP